MDNFSSPINFIITVLDSRLLIKIGAAPFHYWFPQVIEGLNWNLRLLILTWQKIAPFILLSYNITLSSLIIFIIISSSFIGRIIGLNQIRVRKILTFSSINHLSWIIAACQTSLSLWFLYFIIYRLISFNIIILFKKFNIFYIKQLISKLNSNKNIKFFFLTNFLSLGGLPPFLGFLPKWFTINTLINQNLKILSLILIIFSLITLFFYLRINLSSFIILHNEYLNLNLKFNKTLIIMFNFLNIFSLYLVTLIFNVS